MEISPERKKYNEEIDNILKYIRSNDELISISCANIEEINEVIGNIDKYILPFLKTLDLIKMLAQEKLFSPQLIFLYADMFEKLVRNYEAFATVLNKLSHIKFYKEKEQKTQH